MAIAKSYLIIIDLELVVVAVELVDRWPRGRVVQKPVGSLPVHGLLHDPAPAIHNSTAILTQYKSTRFAPAQAGVPPRGCACFCVFYCLAGYATCPNKIRSTLDSSCSFAIRNPGRALISFSFSPIFAILSPILSPSYIAFIMYTGFSPSALAVAPLMAFPSAYQLS